MHLTAFDSPLLNAAGSLGFAPDPHGPIDLSALGAFFTNPITRRPRRPAEDTVFQRGSGRLLLDAGSPNPGLSRALWQYASRWARAPLPIVVHFLVEDPIEVREAVERIEGLENMLAIELGFDGELDASFVSAATQNALGEKPIIARLPINQAQELAAAAADAGAAAVSLGPRREEGDDADGRPGFAYGPTLFAESLQAVRSQADLDLPLIAAGGVYLAEHAVLLLEAGANAVQLDTVLWRNDVNLGSWTDELNHAPTKS